MSYAYYYLYYEKSPNDKPKGAHHTPGKGVVGTLRLVLWSSGCRMYDDVILWLVIS
jgi:hypothetical protein